MRFTILFTIALAATSFTLPASAACFAEGPMYLNPPSQDARQSVVVKKSHDHRLVESPFCGQLIVVSTPKDNPHMDVAVAINIRPTKAHFHKHFQEIYMVLDGTLTLEVYDPTTQTISKVVLGANELAMIPPGVHHRISEASEQNRLQVMCLPGFNAEDEHASDKI